MKKYYVAYTYIQAKTVAVFGSLDWNAEGMDREEIKKILEYIEEEGLEQPVVLNWIEYK